MTKEEILQLCTTEAQKARVNASFEAARRLNKTSVFEQMTDETAIKQRIDSMVEAFEKKQAKKTEKESKAKVLSDAINKCKDVGKTEEQIAEILISAIRKERNAQLQAQIDELRKQML